MVVLVEGFATDPSGACSACAVASRGCGKHTGDWVYPDVVCYLTLHGATQHANRFQPLFGKRDGIKCHTSGTVIVTPVPKTAVYRLKTSTAGNQIDRDLTIVGRNDVVLNGVLHHLRIIPQIEPAHGTILVESDCSGSQVK